MVGYHPTMFAKLFGRSQAIVIPPGYPSYTPADLTAQLNVSASQTQRLLKSYVALLTLDESDPVAKIVSTAGRDLAKVVAALKEHQHLDHGQAANAARWLANAASQHADQLRRKKLGIQFCVWMTSTCGDGARPANPSHVERNGKRFSSELGYPVDGGYEFPGTAPKCTCVSKVILPALDV